MQTRTRENVFRRSWTLLASNPHIVLPGLVIGAVSAIVQVALQPSVTLALPGDYFSRLLAGIVQVIAAVASISYTTGMADAAWRTGKTTFADGAHAFRRDASHVFVAMLALLVAGLFAALLAPLTLGIALLAYIFFCIYTMAAAVVGDRPGFAALAESAAIAYRRPGPTLLVMLGIAAVWIVLSVIAGLVAVAPIVGPLVADIALEAVVAYAALVVVGEYRILRGLPASFQA